MKKINVSIVCIAILLSLVGMASAVGIDSIYMTNISGNTGDIITMPIMISNMDNIGSIQFSIKFDNSVILAQNITTGDIANTLFASNIDNDSGEINISMINATGSSGTGVLANAIFRVIGNDGIYSPITINIVDITDPTNNRANIKNIGNATLFVGITLPNVTTQTMTVTQNVTQTTTVSQTVTQTLTVSQSATLTNSGTQNSTNGSTTGNETSNISVIGTNNTTENASNPVSVQTETPITESTVSTPEETIEKTVVQTESPLPTDNPLDITQKPLKTPGFEIAQLITIISVLYFVNKKRRLR